MNRSNTSQKLSLEFCSYCFYLLLVFLKDSKMDYASKGSQIILVFLFYFSKIRQFEQEKGFLRGLAF